MQQYTSYKNSGFDWIGVIPSNWDVCKLKYYITPSREKTNRALPYIGLENIEGHTGRFVSTDSEYDMRQSLLCKKDDVIFGKLRPYLAKAFLCDEDYCCSSEFVVMRDAPVPKFLLYVLLSAYFVNKVDASTYGAKMPRADISYILNLPIAIPSIKEQDAIVEYLDAATAKIDKAIAQQQRMIDLLNERKKIVINHAVTKGFNPNVKYKETGIAWIGAIPEHWQLMQLRYTVTNHDNLRQPITADQRERNNPQYDYYGASGVIDRIDHYNVDDKVLLIGEDGANLVLRNLPLVYKAEGKFWVNNHAHILKPRGNDYVFLALVLEAADYTLFITGSAQPKLSQANMNAVKLPIPPIEEQREIVAGINPKLERIDSFIEQHSSMVAFLEERKQIIINDVVTGKVKVI
jgi:type I restriction enzyme S subunit